MKKLKGRTICPYCGKSFDNRVEGFLFCGYVVCSECYNKNSGFITLFKARNHK